MSTPILSDQDYGNAARILNLLDPTAAQHPATKAYVDAKVEGLNWKDNVRVASTANINLASPGADIDGVTLSTNDRVLVKDQDDAEDNGIYIFNGAASAMARSADASTAAELVNAIVAVDEGTSNEDTTWRQDEIDITLGTDPVTWVTFGSSVPSASETVEGTVELATQSEVNTGTDALRVVTPATLASWSGRIRKHSASFGNGSNTQFDFSHNFGTTDVQVEIYKNSDGKTVAADITRTDTNTVRVNVVTAPSSNEYRVVITG